MKRHLFCKGCCVDSLLSASEGNVDCFMNSIYICDNILAIHTQSVSGYIYPSRWYLPRASHFKDPYTHAPPASNHLPPHSVVLAFLNKEITQFVLAALPVCKGRVQKLKLQSLKLGLVGCAYSGVSCAQLVPEHSTNDPFILQVTSAVYTLEV